MAIPEFRDDGWLPEGHWPATWEEVAESFGSTTPQRRTLFRLLKTWRDDLRAHGVTGRLLLDGSFVSTKQSPGDIDAIFVIDVASEPVLTDEPAAQALISHSRLKAQGLGDVFSYTETSVRNYPSFCRTDGFNVDKRTAIPKGLVEVRI